MSFPATYEQQEHPNLTPAVQALIAINVAVIFLQLTAWNFTDVSAVFGFDLNTLPGHWWTAITYMFVHAGPWHLLANVYALYLFGPRLEHGWGSRRFLWFYLLCGLGGVAFQMLFFRGGSLVGASAGVFGVMTAYAMQWPEEEVFLMFVVPMRVRTVVVALFVLNLALGIAGTGESANVASAVQRPRTSTCEWHSRRAWTKSVSVSPICPTPMSHPVPFRATFRVASAAMKSTTSLPRARRSRPSGSER